MRMPRSFIALALTLTFCRGAHAGAREDFLRDCDTGVSLATIVLVEQKAIPEIELADNRNRLAQGCAGLVPRILDSYAADANPPLFAAHAALGLLATAVRLPPDRRRELEPLVDETFHARAHFEADVHKRLIAWYQLRAENPSAALAGNDGKHLADNATRVYYRFAQMCTFGAAVAYFTIDGKMASANERAQLWQVCTRHWSTAANADEFMKQHEWGPKRDYAACELGARAVYKDTNTNVTEQQGAQVAQGCLEVAALPEILDVAEILR